jgi:allophanate hydrolase
LTPEPPRAGHRPSETAACVCERIDRCQQPVWITRVTPGALLEAARRLDDADPSLPLYGVTFAVKDNIDVAGLPTTAGCPGAARMPTQTAPSVQRLLDAGALLVGKTNMDQFATGLVGTRSPYGACSSVFDASRVSGGSSSGSAIAVALGLVTFALGTDTAGSGRVPAAFNAVVGLKPSRGLISTRGVVPACASLDCVSVFAGDVAGTARVLDVAAGHDPLDPWSRRPPSAARATRGVVGVPRPGLAEPDDVDAAAAWAVAQERASETWSLAPVDVSPLLDAAPLLYAAWIAERTASLGAIVELDPSGLDPTVAALIRGGQLVRGTDVFAAAHRLAELRARAAAIWDEVDALMLPTAPTHPTHAEVAVDPVGANDRLGRFTSFANLMDLAALALPGPMRRDGLPFGVTLFAPTFEDRRLLELGATWSGEVLGESPGSSVTLAVVGAHMRGLPLNSELTARGARFIRAGRTAARYRLFALPGEGIRRPGLVRTREHGASVELELWDLSSEALGSLLATVPAPLAIGRVALSDGSEVTGFVCEAYAAAGALDVTEYGGWRAYLSSSR